MTTNPTEAPTPEAANADGTVAAADGVVAGQPPADGTGAEGQPAPEATGEPAGDAGAEGDKPDGDKPADEATGAPEAYEDFKLPEGSPEGMELDAEATSAFKEAAKADNLSQGQAQRYVDMAAKLVQKTIDSLTSQGAERITQWAEQVKADPEVGGRNYEANTQVALAAVAKFGDAELKQVFEEYGLGNNPAMVRFAYRIGKAMSESGFVHGQGNESPAKPANREAALAARIEAEQARNK
jgi:hypothetical protein